MSHSYKLRTLICGFLSCLDFCSQRKGVRYMLWVGLCVLTSCANLQESPVPQEPKKTAQKNLKKHPRKAGTNIAPSQTFSPLDGAGRVTKVAILLPLTGKNSSLGKAMLGAAQQSIFDHSTDDSFELLPYDTAADSQGAAEAARLAIREGASLILGPIFATEARAAAELAAPYDILLISFSNDQTIAGRNLFVMGITPAEQVKSLLLNLKDQNIRQIGAMVPNTPFGESIKLAILKLTDQQNIKVSGIWPYDPNFWDFDKLTSPLTTAHKEMQALLLPEGGGTLETILSSLKSQNFDFHKIRLLGTGAWDTPAVLKNPDLIGGWFVAPAPAGRQAFEEQFHNAFKTLPPRMATLAYDATAMAVTLNKQSFVRPFTKNNITTPRGFLGLDGLFRFKMSGTIERRLPVLEITSTGLKIVVPAQQSFGVEE